MLLLAIFAILVATGCSSGDDATTTDETQGQTTDSGGADDDGGTTSGGAGTSGDLPSSVPDDFPIAIPQGWEIDIHAEIGLTGGVTQLLYSKDEFANIVAFYDDWTGSQPDEYAKTETADRVIFTRLETPTYLITVERDHEERGETWTLLQASGSTSGG
ncbi:MAG: hypothetical protein WBZ40_08255 [Acidimicrobiia bacterium]